MTHVPDHPDSLVSVRDVIAKTIGYQPPIDGLIGSGLSRMMAEAQANEICRALGLPPGLNAAQLRRAYSFSSEVSLRSRLWRSAQTPDNPDSPTLCVCGEPAKTTVEVEWADGKRRYRYCDECADDVVFAIEGAEVLP